MEFYKTQMIFQLGIVHAMSSMTLTSLMGVLRVNSLSDITYFEVLSLEFCLQVAATVSLSDGDL